MKNKQLYISLLGLTILLSAGCSSFLDVKSDKSLAVPTTLDDYQAILNEVDNFLAPPEGEIMSADHYLPDQTYDAIACQTSKDLYRWIDNLQIDNCMVNGWALAYKNIYKANVAINGIKDIENSQPASDLSSNIKGQAHFIRGINYFELAQIWLNAYSGEESRTKLGLPLKFSSDFNEATKRATLGETFDQILVDLYEAERFLPLSSANLYLPAKPAVWAYLAKVYLYLHNYEVANTYAAKCLDAGYQLMDYSTVDGTPTFPFKLLANSEIIYARFLSSSGSPASLFTNGVSPQLYEMYEDDDFRKTLFFRYMSNRNIFRGDYNSGSGGNFCGPTIAEMYLILAETHYRMGDLIEARKYLSDFQAVRKSRVPTYADSELLDAILLERRKELLYRGIRFGDVKRLNILGEGITLKRSIREQEYALPPNDPKSALLIPQLVIEKSGIEQNPR